MSGRDASQRCLSGRPHLHRLQRRYHPSLCASQEQPRSRTARSFCQCIVPFCVQKSNSTFRQLGYNCSCLVKSGKLGNSQGKYSKFYVILNATENSNDAEGPRSSRLVRRYLVGSWTNDHRSCGRNAESVESWNLQDYHQSAYTIHPRYENG